jgi:hypothetical protein
MNMEQFQREFFTEAKEGLKNLGQRIVANAQENLKKRKLVGLSAGAVRRGNTIASGDLINSGRTAESDDNQILAGFPMNYAYYVEYGRRAGGYPPFAAIYQWIKDKKLPYADEKDLEQMAFAIRAKIGEKGTKPSPFLRPAYEKNKKSVDSFVAKAVKKVLTKDYTR